MINSDIIIIGGGAAGLVAACAAGASAERTNKKINISIIEKNSRVGKKLLGTGNGRCNLSNVNVGSKFFHGPLPELIENILNRRPLGETLSFFNDIGLHVAEEEGRLYPKSGTASSVLDALRFEAERLNVKTIASEDVSEIIRDKKIFTVKTAGGGEFFSHAVVVATGGKAAPFTGSDGSGIFLLSHLGHSITAPYPALTPLIVKHPSLASLKGIRISGCRVALFSKKNEIAADSGEIIFNEAGISGIPALNISGAAHGNGNLSALVDLAPELDSEEVKKILARRLARYSERPAELFFTGWFHKRVGQALLREAGCDSVNNKSLERLASVIKRWTFPVTGVKGFSSAQATGGGVSLAEFSCENLESKKIPGLFATGEVLDVYGDCGGYNLHWAWTTGFLAGEGAAAYAAGRGNE